MKFLALALARVLNAAFFVASSVYCLLSYSSFAYAQFIKPQLVGWIPDAAAVHHQVFWLTLLVTAPTLVPALRRGSRGQRTAAAAYLAGNAVLGGWLTISPALTLAGPNPRTLVLAALCLMPPFLLAVVDHITALTPVVRPIGLPRLVLGAVAAAIATWLTYVLLIPWYLPRTVGLDLTWSAMTLAVILSLVSHLLVFAVIYLIAAAVIVLAALIRRPLAEYWAVSALCVAALAFIFQRVVAVALSFQARESWVLSAWLSVVVVAIWSGLAWQRRSGDGHPDDDGLDLWFGPMTGPTAITIIGLVALPLLALGLRTAVAQFDWNFLLQKLGVGLVWALALGWGAHATRRLVGLGRGPSRAVCDRLALAMVLVGLAGIPVTTRAAAWSGDPRLAPEFVLDRYAALDGSYQLLRGLIKTNAGADAEFYRFLKAHSTLGFVSASPVNVDFVDRFEAAAVRPHIFLFIVDSLRRDYLSPYNPAVTFTPATQAFAAESVVFDRAFTRYGATGLSVPALWTGGMLLHKQYVQPFAPMQSLEKLLDGAGYRRFMSDDHLVTQLFRPSPATTLLDRRIDEMDHTMCSTVSELQSQLSATRGDARPIFAMTRPLQLHTARLVRDPETPASAYPGFAPGYAKQVAALDRCLGSFVDYLKQSGLYDQSVVILTSDHGESLGENGRWGHAYTLYPEVVEIPLIIHLPSALAATVATDRSRVALSTDITPTLYALAGETPRNLGVLYGRPLFTPVNQPIPSRRRESFLLSSSYGPVHAMLRHNGRSLYIADAVQGLDLAYEMQADGRMARQTMTDVTRTVNRRLMRDHIGQIAAAYHFTPAP